MGSRLARPWFRAWCVGACISVLAPSGVGAAEPALGSWVRPVDGAVVRPFVAPIGRYGPGHRGVDLAAAPGAPVRAANAGTVSFAGSVAGSLHVVVAHGSDLRTSYSFLLRVDVHRGQAVARGQIVGLAGGAGPDHEPGVLHLGLRVGDRYVDPMGLFVPSDLTKLIRLAPVDLPAQSGLDPPGVEARGLAAGLDLPAGVQRMITPAPPGLLEQAGAAVGALVEPVGASAEWALDHTPLGAALRDAHAAASRLLAWGASRAECTDAVGPGPSGGGSGHSVLAVAGIDSETDPRSGVTFDLDTRALGYRAGEVRWFSYADGAGYGRSDTWGDLVLQALALRDQLRAMQRADPGREVDLVAHSQGGVVVDVFLQLLYDPADPTLPPIGTVVTLSSPHQGAPVAAIARDLARTRDGRALLATIREVSGGAVPPADATSVRELGEGSALLRSLWDHRLPDHVDLTSVSGVDDVVVPADHTAVPGARSVTVDPDGLTDHGAIVHDDAAMTAARLALEGRGPPCVGWTEGVRGAIEPVLISRIEHAGGDLLREALTARRLLGRAGPRSVP
jgi:hypothetical protein